MPHQSPIMTWGGFGIIKSLLSSDIQRVESTTKDHELMYLSIRYLQGGCVLGRSGSLLKQNGGNLKEKHLCWKVKVTLLSLSPTLPGPALRKPPSEQWWLR